MSKEELIQKLNECADSFDTEVAHAEADDLILRYINDKEIETAYNSVSKWYA